MSQLTVPEALQQALELHQSGQLGAAESIYRKILQVDPHHADALHLLGIIAQQVGRLDRAIELLSQAVSESPFVSTYYNSLGEALRLAGRLDQAIAAFQNALARNPNQFEAWSNLGLTLDQQGKTAEAEAAYRKALQLNPRFADAHNNLGTNLTRQKRYAEGIAAHRQAVEINPQYAAGWNNLGVAYENADDLENSISAYRRATEIQPDLPESHHNLGVPLVKFNRIAEAKASWQRAIALRPNYADPHFNMGLALLLEGNYEQGWAEHEWRWKCAGLQPPRAFPQPQWDGSDLAGRTVLLHAEQGFGDTVQFVRYAPLIAAKGGRVILECQAELQTLVKTVPGIAAYYATNDPLPPFDFQIPLLSIPYAMKTTLATIPAQVPYLRVPPEALEKWQARVADSLTALASQASGSPSAGPSTVHRSSFIVPRFKVGLAWQGRGTHKDDKNRSTTLATLASLAEVPGVVFYSLQKGPGSEQALTPPPGMNLIDLTADLKDFTDTAALVQQLDLVISVDTSVVHLAGALAKPVWTLLPFSPDWRWLMAREDSPWYPTMRLFRQPVRQDWAPVMARVTAELHALVQQSKEHPEK